MHHTKFRENRPALSGEGHLGHVTQISQSNFRPHYPGMLHKISLSFAKRFQRRRSLKSLYG